jgi:tetratricopeptide (TPR) repeat protein/DNA-binding XRE family transcriptional regulator
MDTMTLGEQVAYHRRRRGLSQVKLAELLDRSESWVSQVERGTRQIDRISVLAEIARVLDVPANQLLPGSFLVEEAAGVHPAVRAVRLALSGHAALAVVLDPDPASMKRAAGAISAMLGRRPRAGLPRVAELEAQADEAWKLAHGSQFVELGELLVMLIPTMEIAAHRLAGEEQRAGFAALAKVYHAAAAIMARLREIDVAWVAAERAIATAERSGDPLLAAAGDFRLAHVFLSGDYFGQAERVVTIACAALEPHIKRDSAPELLSVWGALHLVGAIIASRQDQPEVAADHMEKAEDAATRLGVDRNDFDTKFGPTNVALHAVAAAVELGDAGSALRRAEDIDAARLSPERRGRYLIDLARAYHQRRQSAETLRRLQEAEALTPEEVEANPRVREIIRDLVRDEGRRIDPELRRLAQRVSVLP